MRLIRPDVYFKSRSLFLVVMNKFCHSSWTIQTKRIMSLKLHQKISTVNVYYPYFHNQWPSSRAHNLGHNNFSVCLDDLKSAQKTIMKPGSWISFVFYSEETKADQIKSLWLHQYASTRIVGSLYSHISLGIWQSLHEHILSSPVHSLSFSTHR